MDVIPGNNCIVDCLREKGPVRERIAGWNAPLRWGFWAVTAVVILLFGIYGNGAEASTFAYQFF